jgi:hypothetical protein
MIYRTRGEHINHYTTDAVTTTYNERLMQSDSIKHVATENIFEI